MFVALAVACALTIPNRKNAMNALDGQHDGQRAARLDIPPDAGKTWAVITQCDYAVEKNTAVSRPADEIFLRTEQTDRATTRASTCQAAPRARAPARAARWPPALKIALPRAAGELQRAPSPESFFSTYNFDNNALHIICMCKWSPEKRLYYYNS
jgi:hypothetical protein